MSLLILALHIWYRMDFFTSSQQAKRDTAESFLKKWIGDNMFILF